MISPGTCSVTLRIRYDAENDWIVFEASAKGWLYRKVMVPTMLEQCYNPAQIVVDLVNNMRSQLSLCRQQ